ncbi:hypothetical protein BC830DRAFT_1119672 [Chytriomyces sp. MP71]|nr:hypothetical protein BC830DRAFT_1119672 [Chytriomyces sp. MP71]
MSETDFRLDLKLEPFVGKMLASFRRLYLNQQHSDIEVAAFGHTFKLHRLILSTNSYFDSIINGPWSEQGKDRLELKFDDPNINLESLKIIFARMYGIHETTQFKTNVLSLLAAGCYFDDQALCASCIELIEDDLTPTTIMRYITFAEKSCYGIHSSAITDACLITVCKNASKSEFRDCLLELPEHWLAPIFASDCLYVNNERERYALIKSVMEERIARVGRRERKKSVSPRHLVKPDFEVRNQLAKVSPDDPVFLDKNSQQMHLRETSASSSATLVEESNGKLSEVLEEAAADYFHETASSTELIQSLRRSILSKSVVYANLPFQELQQIRFQDSDVPGHVLHKALWQQMDLRALVLNAGYDTVDLGISYEVRKEDFSDDETSLASTHAEHKASFMPTEDTETMDGSKSLVDLIKIPNKWNSLSCPPFRFGYEFNREQLQSLDVNTGLKVFSTQNFYAGSMWQIYIQKLDGSDGNALGVYMQRMVPEPADGFKDADISHYTDKRIQVRVWFQIICYFANSCCVLESKPDLFKATQSWGWRSTKMYKDTFGETDRTRSSIDASQMFKCVVIIGQT